MHLSVVGKLLQTIVDASIDFNVALPRALLENFHWSRHKFALMYPEAWYVWKIIFDSRFSFEGVWRF